MESGPQIFQFGGFTLDVVRGCVFRAGAEIKLRPKVYETLKYFVEHPGRLIPKEELMRAVWPDAFVTDDSLVQCTLELRRALEDSGQQLLKTVPRRGYLFTAEVLRTQAARDPLPVVLDSFAADEPGRRTLGAARHKRDLPIVPTSLIGRERDVAEAADLLGRPDVRLLTLTGPGGAGKTRLALALASSIAERFTAGVHFVGLASLTDPDLVITALTKALAIQQVPNRTVPQLIADQLEGLGPFLLLLDNFEQILPAAPVIAETLATCPSLKVIVTSRSALRIYGEQELPVAPLAEDSAVELFAQRSAAVWPSFALTPENAPAIREICARLDGLPLAIELAAARTRVLSPVSILDRLDSRLRLLTGGPLDLPQRQQTLRGAIDWSHDLLNDAEKTLFRRLSVFAGGCTLESAEAVCDTAHDLGVDLFEGLSSLVDKNLVQRVDRGRTDGGVTEPRFAMLETIREYALERLSASGEQSATRKAHAAYCLVLAEEGNPELGPLERSRWLEHCDAEIDNFRYALDFLFETRDLDWGLRLCLALFRFWDMREHLTEGRARLHGILRLADTGHVRERARVSLFLGALGAGQGDFAAATSVLHQSLALYQDLGDQHGIAATWNALGIVARDRGDYDSAQSHFERSLACWRDLLDQLAIARCLHNLANVVKVRGDFERARQALREASAIFEHFGDRTGAAWSINQLGDIEHERGDTSAARQLYQRALSVFRDVADRWGVARSLTDIGLIDCEQGDYDLARTAFRDAMEIFSALGHRRGVARILEAYACLALARQDYARALKLCAAADHLRRLIGAPLPPAEQSRLDRKLQSAWQALGKPHGQSAWAEGFSMNLENAIHFSMEDPAVSTST